MVKKSKERKARIEQKNFKKEVNKTSNECSNLTISEIKVNKKTDAHIQATISNKWVECKPKARASSTFVKLNQKLYLFGGEYFDMKSCYVFDDLFKFDPAKSNSWKKLETETTGLRRVGHASCAYDNNLIIHGGEISTISSFLHLNDTLIFNSKTNSWKNITSSNLKLSPSARSGHRMVVCRNHVFLFGGFHEYKDNTTYFNDLYVLNLQTEKWSKLNFSKNAKIPDARSGFVFGANNEKLLLAGGYVKIQESESNIFGKCLNDIWTLDIPKENPIEASKLMWKRISNKFLKRAGVAYTINNDTIYIFGGVYDLDLGGLKIKKSFFYNSIFTLDIPSGTVKLLLDNTDEHSNLQDITKHLCYALVENSFDQILIDFKALRSFEGSINKNDGFNTAEVMNKIILNTFENYHFEKGFDCAQMKIPLPRINAMLCYSNNNLYLTGGMLEFENLIINFDDMWKFDLKKSSWSLIEAGSINNKELNKNENFSSSSEDNDREQYSQINSEDETDITDEYNKELTSSSENE